MSVSNEMKMMKQRSSKYEETRLPLFPQPYHKILETVCLNLQLGDTPLTRQQYITLAIKVTNNEYKNNGVPIG
jgi:hypothetical protein